MFVRAFIGSNRWLDTRYNAELCNFNTLFAVFYELMCDSVAH